MHRVKLTHYAYYDNRTGEFVYDSPADYWYDREAFLAAAGGNRQPPPVMVDEMTVYIHGQEVDFTTSQRIFLTLLQNGRCSRLTVMQHVVSSKSKDPENTMYAHVCQLNKRLEAHGLYIETTPTAYILKSYPAGGSSGK